MKFIAKKNYFIILLLVGFFSVYSFSQSSVNNFVVESSTNNESCEKPTPTPPKAVKPKPTPKNVSAPKIFVKEDKPDAEEVIKTSEKSILTAAKVNVSLCVIEGKVKVTGWERNEVRIFVSEGSEINFKVRQKDKSTDKPILLDIINPNSKSDKPCLSGEDIEIDVPKNATVELGGQESETTFDSFSKVLTETVSGNMFIRNIENGVKARTYEGLITLDKVKGNIEVESASGGIIANNSQINEVTDVFKARTESGVINLQNINHSRLDAKSISGGIKYVGEFLSGGKYNFNTTSGLVLLTVPSNSSCRMTAIFGFGTFNSEIPFKVITEDKTSRLKRSVVQMGIGEGADVTITTAEVTITTFNSSIKIKALKK